MDCWLTLMPSVELANATEVLAGTTKWYNYDRNEVYGDHEVDVAGQRVTVAIIMNQTCCPKCSSPNAEKVPSSQRGGSGKWVYPFTIRKPLKCAECNTVWVPRAGMLLSITVLGASLGLVGIAAFFYIVPGIQSLAAKEHMITSLAGVLLGTMSILFFLRMANASYQHGSVTCTSRKLPSI